MPTSSLSRLWEMGISGHYTLALCVVAAFVLGSIPTGYVIAKIYGVDIRRKGSGNIGATNVHRTLGKGPGILTLLGDLLKGAAAALIPAAVSLSLPGGLDIAPLLGFCAILGHCFSPFLALHGGKGVATSFGVFLVLAPGAALLGALSFAVILAATRYVSLSSMLGVCTVVLSLYINTAQPLHDVTLLFAAATAALVIVKHRTNIDRLLTGTESKLRG